MAFPWMSLAPLLGGLFGGEQDPEDPELPPEVRRMYQFLAQMARQQLLASRRPALAGARERLALAQDTGQAGEMLAGRRKEMMAQVGPENAPNLGDFLQNVSSQETGSLMNLFQGHLLASLDARRQQKMNAAGLAGQAGGLASSGYRSAPQTAGGGTDLSAILGQLAQAHAYQQSRKRTSQPGVPPGPVPVVNQQPGAGAGPFYTPPGGYTPQGPIDPYLPLLSGRRRF